MPALKFQCENCDCIFTVNYKEEECETDPSFCSFCAEPLFYDEDLEVDDE